MRTDTRDVGITRVREGGRPGAWTRLVSDQRGQELLEYGLLIETIGIVGALSLPILQNRLSTSYSSQDTWIQQDWCMNPDQSPCAPPP